MNKKLPKLISLFAVTSCLLTGCFPTGQQSIPSQGTSSISSDISESNTENNDSTSYNTSEIKNLKVNVKFEDNYPTEAPTLTNVVMKCWDSEKVKKLFFGWANNCRNN